MNGLSRCSRLLPAVSRTARRCNATTNAPSPPPQELLTIIQQQIRANGPLPLPRYMAYCLSHPTLGYYTRLRAELGSDTVLGKQGDFITSPEISQVFGELIAVWFVAQWQAQGSPQRTRLIELGPGKGTLMEDMLRTFHRIRSFSATLNGAHLVETSEYMRGLQRQRLEPPLQAMSANLQWHSQLQDITADDDAFTMLVAHEFFDALPIHLFERRQEGWREVMVDNASIIGGPPLRLAVSPGATLPSELYTKHPRLAELQSIGARVEVCPDAFAIATEVGKLIESSKAGGAALIIDYGDEKLFGSSLRAFKRHQLVDPFTEPGQADLTANVDFSWLGEAIDQSAQATKTLTQRDFLGSLGLQVRLDQLIKRADPARQDDIFSAVARLVDPLTMGTQYRVLAAVPKSAALPIPFAASI